MMMAFWNRKRTAALTEWVTEALGTQVHEFNVPGIVQDLLHLDKPHEWQFWTIIHRHDSFPENRVA